MGDDRYRVERDTLGEVSVPASALYGAQTQRAVEDFTISGLPVSSRLSETLPPGSGGRLLRVWRPVTIMNIANDLRWMNSGPQAGLAEISLPPLQPGSSIMPGKINPVIPEAAAMACA